MTDDEILIDRQSKYGPPKLFFKTYGEMCRLLDEYSSSSNQETILKVLRSAWNPNLEDNYKDGRNYITIAEECAKNKDTY